MTDRCDNIGEVCVDGYLDTITMYLYCEVCRFELELGYKVPLSEILKAEELHHQEPEW